MKPSAEQAASELVTDLNNKKRKELSDWKREVEEAFKDDGDEPVALRMSGKLMSFDKSGKLVVHFSERLVNLLREARQLCAIGCQVSTPCVCVRAHTHTRACVCVRCVRGSN